MKKLGKIFLTAALAVSVLPAYGQIGLSIESESGYTSNAFASSIARADYFTGLQGGVTHDWVKDSYGVRGYYQGELTAYRQFRDRTYQTHTLGMIYYHDWDSSAHRLNAGWNVSKRFHSDVYRYYELVQGSGYANVKLVLSDHVYAYAGVNLKWRRYALLDAFSNYQSTLFYRISSFFNTGTSLILETDLLSKKYTNMDGTGTLAELPEVVTLGDGSSQQWIGLLRIGQSLSPRTGLSLEALLRKNLRNSVRYLGNYEGYYYSDEELFDDVFGYHGEQASMSLKQMLPWKLKGDAGVMVSWKDYDQRLAFQLDGEPYTDNRLRQDRRLYAWLSLSRPLQLKTAWQPVQLTLSWYGWRNHSNDPYYDYSSSYWSFGLSQAF